MSKQTILIIAASAFVLTVLFWLWPAGEQPLDPPEEVAKRLETAKTTEEKVEAAQNLIRHGEVARTQIRFAIEQNTQAEPEVVAPLIQATVKSKDYHSLPTLIKLMESPDPVVRGRAGAAVQKLMGADYGFRAKMNSKERAKIIARIRAEHEFFKDRFAQVYGH